jgi:hypothetical protein
MIEILAAVALVLSVISCAASAMLIIKREDIHGIESKLRTQELELADVVDRLSVWQRRDAARARTVARGTPNEQGGLFPDQHGAGGDDAGAGSAAKQRLRAVARSRGLM